MGISRDTAQQHLDAWLAADMAVSRGQRYKIADRELTRADAAEIRKNIDYWQGHVSRAVRGGRRMTIGYGVKHG